MAKPKEEEYKKEKVSPFVWVEALTTKKGDPLAEHGAAAYPAFMVNRAMSQYQDCIFHAAEINLYQDLDQKMSYDYYKHAIRAGKRFGKWGKKKDGGDVGMLMEHYRINRTRAEECLRVLSPEQLEIIREIEKARDAS